MTVVTGLKIDKADRMILALLQRDAELSVAEVADKVGVSKSACWRRIQKLEANNVILERVTLLNQHEINVPLTVYISVRTNQHNDEWADSFNKILCDIPEVIEMHRMSGDLDYLVKAVVPDMPGYDSLYKKIIKADLFDVSSSFVMETTKQTTQMPLTHIKP